MNLNLYVNFFKTFCKLPGDVQDELNENRINRENNWMKLYTEENKKNI